MMVDIGLIGPLNIDLLITGQAPTDMQELTRWAGPSNVMLCSAGSAGYVSQDLAKLGLKTGLVSTLADDAFGDAILRIMSEAGLDMTHVNRQQDTLSGIGIYMLLFGSKKRPLTYRMPTHLPWPKPFSPAQRDFLLEGCRHIHCAGYLHFPDMWNNEMAQLFREAKQKGLTTSLDPQFVLFPIETPWLEPLRELLRYTDLLMLDEDEARQISLAQELEQAIETLQAQGPRITVVKRGAQGSWLSQAGKRRAQPAIRKLPAIYVPEEEIVDAIGAGDAFDAGMIFGFLQGWSMDRCQEFATRTAALTLRRSGGTEGLAVVG
jgi:2-dehydro-3-deoxygluconokinase